MMRGQELVASFRSIVQSEDLSQIGHHEPAGADGTVGRDPPQKA